MAVGLPPVAGGRIQAATIAAIAPLCVIKPTDQSVTSSTTLVSDNALVLPLPVANATYIVVCYLDYEGGTQGSSDLKVGWSVPSGTTWRYQAIGIGTSGGMGFGNTYSAAGGLAFGSQGSSNLCGATMIGSLVMSTTTGNLQFKWAQNSSSGTATIVHAQSFVAAWRIS